MRLKHLFASLLVLGLMASSLGTASAKDADDAYYPLDTYPPTAADNAVLQWNEETLECIRTKRERPTVVARALFVVHASIYDAWTGYDARAVPTIRTGWARRPSSQRTLANKSQAVSHAAYVALSDLFPGCQASFDERLRVLGYSTADATAAAADGRRAGRNVVNARRNDGANQAGNYADTTGYQPSTNGDPWRWQPLTVGGVRQTALTPQWGRVRSFDPGLAGQAVQLDDPRKLSEQERQELIDEHIAYSAALNDRTKVIAEYWADGPRSELPPGHWNLFAQWASRRYRQSLDDDARMFFGLNGALLDSSIAAWRLKYNYDLARPATVIPRLRAGQTITAWAGPGHGTQQIQGENWVPYQPLDFPTPPFPGYISGHSTFSGAASAFLKDFGALMGRDGSVFGGSVTIPPGTSRVEPGLVPAAPVTLQWRTWEDAANEAGVSRQYGGIHWSIDDDPARELGKKIGESAFSVAKKLWEGG